MNVELLVVPDCPHQPVARRNLDAALVRAGHTDVAVHEQVVSTVEQAARLGMHGSPTILIDGTDPFCANGEPSLACRVGFNETSGLAVPSVERLIEVLGR